MRIQDIKNVAYRGAGVKGNAYVGVDMVLENLGIIDQLEKVSGVSAGSIVAIFRAMKFTSKEIFDIMRGCDFSTFADGNIITDLQTINKFGLHPGTKLLAWLKSVIAEKISPTATFADFKKAGFLDLHIFACSYNTKSKKRFSNETTPNACVAEAARCSSGIPWFFEGYKFDSFDGKIYCDGGTMYNYPLTAFDVGIRNPSTLGLYIGRTTNDDADNNIDFGESKKAAIALYEMLLKGQDEQLYCSPEDMARTMFIPDCGISATNFNLTFDDKATLLKAGIKSAQEFFKINITE